jgi:hypothetical protein
VRPTEPATGAVQDIEIEAADADAVAFLEPAVRCEIAHSGHAEPFATLHHGIQQKPVVDVRPDDLDLQRVAQFGRAADMVDVAVRQPDRLDIDVRLGNGVLDQRYVTAGIDHHRLASGFVPQQHAVLLEQGDGNDDRACRSGGLGCGLSLLAHRATMLIFADQPRGNPLS